MKRRKIFLAVLLAGAVIAVSPVPVHADETQTQSSSSVESSSLPSAEDLGVDEETYKQLLSERNGGVKMTETIDDPQQSETNTCPVVFEIVNMPDNFSTINDNPAYMQIQSDRYTVRIPATANEEYKHTCYVPEGDYTIQICAFLNDTRQTWPIEMPEETTFTASPDKETTVAVKMSDSAVADAEAGIKATQIDNQKAEEEEAVMSASQEGNAGGRNYDPEVGPGDEVVKSMSEINKEHAADQFAATVPEKKAVKPWGKSVIILLSVIGAVAVCVLLGVRKFRKDNRDD